VWRSRVKKQADLALVACVIGIFLILFTPIPPALLDLLIVTNFAFALTILLLTFYVARPVDFSTFPSLLLVATLFRLSLNIAATRLILSSADAGRVIGAIGEFVVQGNFVIGFIIFLILIVVQYVVVTGGAQRVSEVAARFVLDAMPGQQMSIDADLNMGLIDQSEAQRRRKALEKEAGFYGAMDGASKFVKGDAIAGVIILLINIFAGWAVSIAQLGMDWQQALRTFTLLTIGDGIVTQVPALIISVATGLIVTRSASDNELGAEVWRQLVQFPKVQILVAVALFGLLLLPGMPGWPAILVLVVVAFAWLMRRQSVSTEAAREGDVASSSDASTAKPNGMATPSELEVSFGSVLAADLTPHRPALTQRVAALREDLNVDLGITLPAVSFRDASKLPPDEYRISLFGTRYAQAPLYANKTLAIHAGENAEPLGGEPTKDPAFGLPAVWIDPAEAAKARRTGYTIVDPVTVMLTHLTEVIKANVPRLLSRASVMELLEQVRASQPGMVEELIPSILAVSDVQQVLRNLLAEHVSIRYMDRIVEVLLEYGRHEKDAVRLSEHVRGRLGYDICQTLRGDQDFLSVLTLDPSIESRVLENLRTEVGAGFVLEPVLAEKMLGRLLAMSDAMTRQNKVPVLLCRPEIRRAIKLFSQRVVPRLAVVSMTEVPNTMNLKAFGIVGAS